MVENIQQLEEKVMKKHKNITGIMVQKSNQIVYEQYFDDAGPEDRFHIYSVTKSIVALLMGIAVDKGLIGDIHQKIMDFFRTIR